MIVIDCHEIILLFVLIMVVFLLGFAVGFYAHGFMADCRRPRRYGYMDRIETDGNGDEE